MRLRSRARCSLLLTFLLRFRSFSAYFPFSFRLMFWLTLRLSFLPLCSLSALFLRSETSEKHCSHCDSSAPPAAGPGFWETCDTQIRPGTVKKKSTAEIVAETEALLNAEGLGSKPVWIGSVNPPPILTQLSPDSPDSQPRACPDRSSLT